MLLTVVDTSESSQAPLLFYEFAPSTQSAVKDPLLVANDRILSLEHELSKKEHKIQMLSDKLAKAREQLDEAVTLNQDLLKKGVKQ